MKEGVEQDIVSGILNTSVHVIMTSILLMAIRGFSRSIYIPGILGELVRLTLFTLLLFFCLRFIVKLSTLNMRECYISYPNISFGGILIALIVPTAVVFAITRLPGHLSYNRLSREYIVAVIIPLVIDRGLGSGINEEMVFRGVLLKITEQSFGKKTAVFIVSFVFGALHLLNEYPTFSEKVLMLVCTISMGILLSMVTLRSGNIWNAVLLHAFANISEVIITLGNSPEFISPFVYIFTEDISSWSAKGRDFIAVAYIIVIWGVIIFLAQTSQNAWCDEP